MRIAKHLFVSNNKGNIRFPSCTSIDSDRRRRVFRKVADWIGEEDGTTAVEYAVMVAMIAVVVVVSVNLMTEAAEENFTATADAIAGV